MNDIHFDWKLVSVKFSGFAFAFPTLSLGFCTVSEVSYMIHAKVQTNLEILLLLLSLLTTGTHLDGVVVVDSRNACDAVIFMRSRADMISILLEDTAYCLCPGSSSQ